MVIHLKQHWFTLGCRLLHALVGVCHLALHAVSGIVIYYAVFPHDALLDIVLIEIIKESLHHPRAL